jgi:hypothetical protein
MKNMEDSCMEDSWKDDLKYINSQIRAGLGLSNPRGRYGKSLLSRVVPLLIYRQKLEEALLIYRKRHYPEKA